MILATVSYWLFQIVVPLKRVCPGFYLGATFEWMFASSFSVQCAKEEVFHANLFPFFWWHLRRSWFVVRHVTCTSRINDHHKS